MIYIDINKHIFADDLITDVITTTTVLIISIVSTIGGVGGGGLILPLYMLVNGFSLYEAIPLSVSTILGNVIVRIIYYVQKSHPTIPNRKMIYLLPILIITPFDANTSFIGVIISNIMPPLVTLAVIIIVLGFTFIKTLNNGIQQYRKSILSCNNNNGDNKNNNDKDKNNDDVDDINNANEMDGMLKDVIIIDNIEMYDQKKGMTNNINIHSDAGDSNIKLCSSMILLVIFIIIVSLFSIGIGHYGICSDEAIILVIIQFICIGLTGSIVCYYVRNETITRQNNNYSITESDISFSTKRILMLVIMSSITGILSTYMGIGGGMLINPLLINLGLSADVVLATASVTTFYSSLITVINYIISNRIMWEYALVWGITSSVGSGIGLCIISRYGRKYNYGIVIMLSIIIFISIIMIIVNTIITNGQELITDFKFNDICN